MNKETAVAKAIDFANKKYGYGGVVKFILSNEQELIEDDEIYYIPFVEEEDKDRKSWGGACKGVVIDKLTGELFQPGSAYHLEKWIWGFKLGFRGDRLDFIIKRINNKTKAIELIESLGIQYVVPELEDGVIWKIPKVYNRKEIEERLSRLPCVFKNQGLTIALSTIEKIVHSKAFEFETTPTKFEVKGIYGELVDKNDLMK